QPGSHILRFTKLFKVEKEECLVVPVVELSKRDWPPEGEAVIVAALGIANVLAGFERAERAGIGKWGAGVQNLIDKVVVRAAVVLVGAGLHGVVEVASTGLAELGREVAHLNGHFLDRVEACLGDLVELAVLAIGGVLAFDANRLSVSRHAVHSK